MLVRLCLWCLLNPCWFSVKFCQLDYLCNVFQPHLLSPLLSESNALNFQSFVIFPRIAQSVHFGGAGVNYFLFFSHPAHWLFPFSSSFCCCTPPFNAFLKKCLMQLFYFFIVKFSFASSFLNFLCKNFLFLCWLLYFFICLMCKYYFKQFYGVKIIIGY